MSILTPLLGPLATQIIGALGQQTQPAASGFSINDFMSNLTQNDEVAFTDLFNVTINLPPSISQSYGTAQLALTCKGAEFPAIDVNHVTYRHHAFNRYLPRSLSYSPLTLNFYVTGGMAEKLLFDAWVNACVNSSGNGPGLIQYRLDGNGVPQYEADIIINQYDKAGNLTYYAEVKDCYPSNVGALNLDWADNNPHHLPVTFMYTKWLNPTSSGDGLPLPNTVTNYTNQVPGLNQAVQAVGPLLSRFL